AVALYDSHLDHLRGQGDDAHEALVAQLSSHRAEYAGTAGLQRIVDQHRRVLVKTDIAAVRPAVLLLRPHDHAAHDVALLHGRARHGVFDRGDEDVADAGVATARAAQHLDAEHL